MLESPTGTQANKDVLSETTDKFSSVQEVAMFASLMLQILKNLGLSEFEARLPTIPPRRYFLSFKSTGRKTDRPSLQLHCVRQTCKRRYEMRSIQAKNAPPRPFLLADFRLTEVLTDRTAMIRYISHILR